MDQNSSICPFCDSICMFDQLKCSNCNFSFSKDSIVCSKCNYINDKESNYCIKCSNKLIKADNNTDVKYKKILFFFITIYFLIISPLGTIIGLGNLYSNIQNIKNVCSVTSSTYINYIYYSYVYTLLEIIRTTLALTAGLKIKSAIPNFDFAHFYMNFYIKYWIITSIILNYWFKTIIFPFKPNFSYAANTIGQILGALIIFLVISKMLKLLQNYIKI